MGDSERGVVEAADDSDDLELPPGSPFPPLDSMLGLFNWYSRAFCRSAIRDCRGYSVLFREEDFVHLVKVKDRYGKEPKHRADAVRRIKAGELKMFCGGARSAPNFPLHT